MPTALPLWVKPYGRTSHGRDYTLELSANLCQLSLDLLFMHLKNESLST